MAKRTKTTSTEPNDILLNMELKKDGKVNNILSFDGDTGELIISKEPNENNVVVDQIYRDGFFSFN